MSSNLLCYNADPWLGQAKPLLIMTKIMDEHFIVGFEQNHGANQRLCSPFTKKVHVAIKEVAITTTAPVLGRKVLWSKILML